MFSLQLKELRIKRGLSQKELAGILNVSTGTVGNWEAGTREPDFAMATKIADYFNVSLDYLIGRTEREERGENRIISQTETQLIEAFRKVGKKSGEDGQRLVISLTESLGK